MRMQMTAKMKIVLTVLLLVKLALIIHLSTNLIDIGGRFWGDRLAFGQEENGAAKTDPPAEKASPAADGQTGQATETAIPEPEAIPKENVAAVEEIKITLESLEQKRLEIQSAEKRLADEKRKLEDLKQEIAVEIESLAKKNQQLDEKLKAVESKDANSASSQKAAEEKKLKQLVKVYANMKPKEAAPIIDKLDIEVAEKIFLRMKGEQAGQILAYVDEERAARISERLAENNKRKKTP